MLTVLLITALVLLLLNAVSVPSHLHAVWLKCNISAVQENVCSLETLILDPRLPERASLGQNYHAVLLGVLSRVSLPGTCT